MAYFGYTQLAGYLKCPYRFFLERVQKVDVPLDERRHYLGTVLAKVMERFYKSQHWRSVDPLTHLQSSVQTEAYAVDAASICPWEPGERERTLALATSMLPTILTTLRQERLLGLKNYAELGVEITIGKDRVIGRPDLVIESPGGEPGLWVVDGKAGGTLGRHVHTNQLRFYALGLIEHADFRRPPDKAGFWWFRHGTVIWKKVTIAALDKTRQTLVDAIAQLRAKEFPTKPGPDCRYCDVRAHCPDGLTYLRQQIAEQVPLGLDENVGPVSL